MLPPLLQREAGIESPSMHDEVALADSVIMQAKWPLRWLHQTCLPAGRIPHAYDPEAYQASWELSKLSGEYQAFEEAYTYASLGALHLTLEGSRIVSQPPMKRDARYAAYDRLVDLEHSPRFEGDLEPMFARIERSLRLSGDRFSYTLNPSLVALGVTCAKPKLGPSPGLPPSWQFSRYSMGDFHRLAQVLKVICLIHFYARICAARAGLLGLGYSDSIIVMEASELKNRLTRYTGLASPTITALMQDLTYGARGIISPDPALQPLVKLTEDRYGIAPSLVLNSSLERNFVVLMNRIPEERALYTGLSAQRECLSRNLIVDAIQSLSIRQWHGHVPQWGETSEIDLALMDDESKSCIILELKSFVAPAEPRETWERSEEIEDGVAQIHARRAMMTEKPEPLYESLDIDNSWQISWAVASESSVGSFLVQDETVPVIRTQHLIHKILAANGVRGIDVWLNEREYLPVEGVHYEVIDVERRLAGWTLEWYGIGGKDARLYV